MRTERPKESYGPNPEPWRLLAGGGTLSIFSAAGNLAVPLVTGKHLVDELPVSLTFAILGALVLFIGGVLRQRAVKAAASQSSSQTPAE